jgi:hypothetical protein
MWAVGGRFGHRRERRPERLSPAAEYATMGEAR